MCFREGVIQPKINISTQVNASNSLLQPSFEETKKREKHVKLCEPDVMGAQVGYEIITSIKSTEKTQREEEDEA